MKIEHKPKILLRRRASLGDVIMTTGVARELHKKYGGELELSVITEYTEVYANNPYVKQVYHTNRPMTGMIWDVEYNLDNAYEINPCNHYIDSYYFRVFGHNDLDKKVELYPSQHDVTVVNDLISKEIESKFIVLHMRYWAWEFKNVKPEIWQKIIDGVLKQTSDVKLVLVGNQSDYNIQNNSRIISLHSKLNVTQMKVLLDNASCFVGIDSGPYAAAAATNVPIVLLSSHLSPKNIMPYRGQNVLGYKTIPVISKVECAGCYEEQIRPVSSVICKYGDYRCNRLFDAEQIVESILESIS